MDNNDKQIIMQCFHCGNRGLMNVVTTINEKFGGNNMLQYGEMEYQYTWKVLSCPVCRFITIYQIYTDESLYFEDYQDFEECIIYPENKMQLDHVPKTIAHAFKSALKVKKINKELCTTALRKTLEMICKDKNAVGKNLDNKIQNLIDINIFPKELNNAYYLIRKYGNDGTHEDKVNLTNYEIDELIKILYDIINYLYILPAKIDKMKEKYDTKKKGTEC